MNTGLELSQGFRAVPKTGVIFVMTEAMKAGYRPGDPQWVNLGQGAPETGSLPGAPERIGQFTVSEEDCEYSPVDGLGELRDAVANLYNIRYRRGRGSLYTRENVAISAGGRVGLTRVISTIGRTNVGHFLPDYTAYEELLDSFSSFVSIPILLDPERDYSFSAADLQREILGRGLSAILLSNPANPTGKVLSDELLGSWVDVSRTLNCALIVDEFYSHYIYSKIGKTISAAEFVDDVNRDPVVIIDGLTKNWRYPGWRVSWTVAPKRIIESLSSAGSFLDGGCPRPMQRAALQLVTPEIANQEATAIQNTFSDKKALMLKGLTELGVTVRTEPEGGFYCWGDLSKLPEPLRNGMAFFREALKDRLITVPGSFFDINPGHRRPDRPGRFENYSRFSFGPSADQLVIGLSRLNDLVGRFR